MNKQLKIISRKNFSSIELRFFYLIPMILPSYDAIHYANVVRLNRVIKGLQKEMESVTNIQFIQNINKEAKKEIRQVEDHFGENVSFDKLVLVFNY